MQTFSKSLFMFRGCLKLEILEHQYSNSSLKLGFASKKERPKRTLKNTYSRY